jgi:acyl-coenzyme A synthetase/AMP-(fatty) acid ligase
MPIFGETLWYRTGDFVKQDAKGRCYFLGRIDDQVKIRGYRIELQEVEAVLRRAAGHHEAVAIAYPMKNGSADGVIAFMRHNGTADEKHVLTYCRKYLPDYMVPRAVRFVPELPLNGSGKIDRRRLLGVLGEHDE